MSKWKKRIFIAIAGLLIAIVVATPTTLLILERRVDTKEVVLQSFAMNYGTKGTIKIIKRVKDIYLVQWEDAEAIYTSLYIEGVWVELGSTPK